jgi:hypothetical protein
MWQRVAASPPLERIDIGVGSWLADRPLVQAADSMCTPDH